MLRLAACLILIAAAPSLAAAHESTAANEAAVTQELNSLCASIDRLTKVLEKSMEKRDHDGMLQKLDIAISYLNFRSRRIESLQHQVQSSGNSRERIEDILKQWELREESLQEALRSAAPGEETEIEQTLENARIQRTILKEKLSRIDTDIIKMQNRIYDLQNQLDGIEEFIQDNLEL